MGGIEFSPWVVIDGVLGWLMYHLGDENACLGGGGPDSGALSRKFVDHFLIDVLDAFVPMTPGDGEPVAVTKLRSRLRTMQIRSGESLSSALSAESCELALSVIGGGVLDVDVEIRDIAYALAVRLSELSQDERAAVCSAFPELPGSPELVDAFVAGLDRLEAFPDERDRLLDVIGTMQDKERALNLAIGDKVRSQDAYYLIRSVARNSRDGSDVAWAFVLDNRGAIYEKLKGMGAAGRGYGALLCSLAGLARTDERRDPLLEAYGELPEEDQVQWQLQNALDKMQRNQEWEAANSEPVCAYIIDMLN